MKMCVHSITAFMTAAASGELALSPDYTASGERPSMSFSLYSSSVTALYSSAPPPSPAVSTIGGHKLVWLRERFCTVFWRKYTTIMRFAPHCKNNFRKSLNVCGKFGRFESFVLQMSPDKWCPSIEPCFHLGK